MVQVYLLSLARDVVFLVVVLILNLVLNLVLVLNPLLGQVVVVPPLCCSVPTENDKMQNRYYAY